MRSKRNWRKTENEELTVGNQLATLEEQLNQLIGRDIRTEFKVSPVPELLSLQLDVARARAQALEYRLELREVRLRVK